MIVTFAIGNSDDKLPQATWSGFVADVYAAVRRLVDDGARVQFAGFSDTAAPWQNALWAIELPGDKPDLEWALRDALRGLARTYGQNAVAWWEAAAVEKLEPAG